MRFWHSYGCKCGSALEFRSETEEHPTVTCVECDNPMVHMASWSAEGARYDSSGSRAQNAIALLVEMGMDEKKAKGLVAGVGPALAADLVSEVKLMVRKQLP